MATSIQALETFFKETDLKCQVDSEKQLLTTVFSTATYVDENNVKSVVIIFSLAEDGEYLRVTAPFLYRIPYHEMSKAVLTTLLIENLQSKSVKYVYDASNGEISLNYETYIEDNSVTHRQIARILHGITQNVDSSFGKITHALNTGGISEEYRLAEREGEEFMKRFLQLDSANRASIISELDSKMREIQSKAENTARSAASSLASAAQSPS
jgi:hypothetical protein